MTATSAPLPPDPRQMQSFVAFDYGMKRTGAAYGTRMLGSARPLPTINAEGKARFTPMESLIRQWQPDALVVGVPYHPDGAAHENTTLALRFARQLRGRFGLPVFEVDERYGGAGQRRTRCRCGIGLHYFGAIHAQPGCARAAT